MDHRYSVRAQNAFPHFGRCRLSAAASKSAAALVQAKQRELVLGYVRDWGFSHRQAFEEAKKNHPEVFKVDAVDNSGAQQPMLTANRTIISRPAIVHAEGDCVIQGGFYTDLRNGEVIVQGTHQPL